METSRGGFARERIVQTEIQRRLLDNRDQERQALAQDFQVGPVQDLSSLLFTNQFAKEAIPDLAMKVELDTIGLGLQTAIHLRGMINLLRPPSLIRFGLSKALQFFMEDFSDKHPEIEFQAS